MVVVNVHWGDEYQHEPSQAQRRLASVLTRSPAVTAVIGQHVHVVQPIRRINRKLVVFGEGNLVSNQTPACCAPGAQDGIVVLLRVRAVPGGKATVTRVDYVPVWVRRPDYVVVPVWRGRVEKLAPDVSGHPELIDQVLGTRPEVFAHNVETVPRIFRRIRPGFDYQRSLDVLTRSRDAGLVTKSNLILGMGETRAEISQALTDLREAGAHLVTITQYLRPNVRLHPIERWVTPQEFAELAEEASEIGFEGVLSGPLVRSSYRAGRLYRQALQALGRSV